MIRLFLGTNRVHSIMIMHALHVTSATAAGLMDSGGDGGTITLSDAAIRQPSERQIVRRLLSLAIVGRALHSPAVRISIQIFIKPPDPEPKISHIYHGATKASIATTHSTMPKASRSLNVLVVGAGLGGLAAGLAMQTDGHKVTIIDSAPQFAEVSVRSVPFYGTG